MRALVAGDLPRSAPRSSAPRPRPARGSTRSARRRWAARRPGPARDDPGLFRLAIDRAFTVPGHGTVVTGTVASGGRRGRRRPGMAPRGPAGAGPGDSTARPAVERVGRGARAAVNLVGRPSCRGPSRPGARRARIPGVDPASSPSRSAPVADAPRPLRHRGRYRLHLGTAEVAATLALLDPEALAAGGAALAQVFLSRAGGRRLGSAVRPPRGEPPGDPRRRPGAGTLGPSSPTPRPRLDRTSRAAPLARPDRARLGRPGGRGPSALVRPWRSAGRPDSRPLEVGPALAALKRRRPGRASGRPAPIDPGPGRVRRRPGRPRPSCPGPAPRARPRQSAIPRAHVAAELPDLAGEALVAALLDRLQAAALVVLDARAVALKGHEPRLSQGERGSRPSSPSRSVAGGFSPPDLVDLAPPPAPRAAAVADLLRSAPRRGTDRRDRTPTRPRLRRRRRRPPARDRTPFGRRDV